MRITEKSLAAMCLNNINQTNNQIITLQTQLATGKRVNKVSDDPQASDTIMRLNSLIAANDQYSKNTDSALSFMETTTSVLGNLSDLISNIKTVVTQATNGSVNDYTTYGEQINEYLSEAVNLANTQYNGKYIFGGTNSLQAPFTLAPDGSTVTANPNGISGSIQIPIADGLKQTTNIDGQEALNGTTIFSALITIRDELNSNSEPTATDGTAVDDALSTVLAAAGKAGLIANQLTDNGTYLTSQKTQLQSLLSTAQDTDTAGAMTQLQQDQLSLQAALQITGGILPKSLLDYLAVA